MTSIKLKFDITSIACFFSFFGNRILALIVAVYLATGIFSSLNSSSFLPSLLPRSIKAALRWPIKEERERMVEDGGGGGGKIITRDRDRQWQESRPYKDVHLAAAEVK